MVLSEITGGIELNSNDLSFIAAVIIVILFYYQYKRYEEELENEEMIEQFLNIP